MAAAAAAKPAAAAEPSARGVTYIRPLSSYGNRKKGRGRRGFEVLRAWTNHRLGTVLISGYDWSMRVSYQKKGSDSNPELN